MLSGLGWVQEDTLIWVPNMAGSICFLAASYLVLIEISHGWWSFEPRQVAWWIVIVNLLGSVAFQISALYGFFPPPVEIGRSRSSDFPTTKWPRIRPKTSSTTSRCWTVIPD